MSFFKKQKLKVIATVYWFLLTYIISGLAWWYIALERQNKQMFVHRVEELKKDDPSYMQQYAEIENARQRKSSGYMGEGVTFLLVILVGAVYVYRATRRQLRLSHQQQNFMMAVTHELKTPIAVISLNLETLQKRKLEEAQQQKLIATSIQETHRLNVLTNNILVASQLETGAYRLNKQEINLSELAENCILDFKNRNPNRYLQYHIEPGIYINGEISLLRMLINNLLDNALKYSQAEALVMLVLEKKKGKIILAVNDEGSGIPDMEKKNVFEKFYRIGNETTRTAKGTGMGLYLCKKIVQDHNGTISIADNQPVGSIFTVTF